MLNQDAEENRVIRAAYINFHMSLTLRAQQGLEGMICFLPHLSLSPIFFLLLLPVGTRATFAV